MKNIEISRYGDFEVATAKGVNRFWSWAKMGKIQADSPISEPGAHVWFNFGSTREMARERILAELGLIPTPAKLTRPKSAIPSLPHHA